MGNKNKYNQDQNYGTAIDGTRLPKDKIPYYNHLHAKRKAIGINSETKATIKCGENKSPEGIETPTIDDLIDKLSKGNALKLIKEFDEELAKDLKSDSIKDIRAALRMSQKLSIYKIDGKEEFDLKVIPTVKEENTEPEIKSEESTVKMSEQTFKEDYETIFTPAMAAFANENSLDVNEEMTLRVFAQSLEIPNFDSIEQLSEIEEQIIIKLKNK